MTSQIVEKEMLLNQFYNISLQINEHLVNLDVNELLMLIERKSFIIKKLKLLKNVDSSQFVDLIQKIKTQEEINLEAALDAKIAITRKLRALNKSVKIKNIYDNKIMQGSIVDMIE